MVKRKKLFSVFSIENEQFRNELLTLFNKKIIYFIDNIYFKYNHFFKTSNYYLTFKDLYLELSFIFSPNYSYNIYSMRLICMEITNTKEIEDYKKTSKNFLRFKLQKFISYMLKYWFEFWDVLLSSFCHESSSYKTNTDGLKHAFYHLKFLLFDRLLEPYQLS